MVPILTEIAGIFGPQRNCYCKLFWSLPWLILQVYQVSPDIIILSWAKRTINTFINVDATTPVSSNISVFAFALIRGLVRSHLSFTDFTLEVTKIWVIIVLIFKIETLPVYPTGIWYTVYPIFRFKLSGNTLPTIISYGVDTCFSLSIISEALEKATAFIWTD